MLHIAAKLIAMLSLLFHAGTGCCAHHDHCSGPNATPPSAQRLATQTMHQCECVFHAHGNGDVSCENSDEQTSDRSSCPCDEPHGRCSDHCSWVTNARVELPSGDGIALPAANAGVELLHGAGVALITGHSAASPPRLSELPDSLRARTQVWRL